MNENWKKARANVAALEGAIERVLHKLPSEAKPIQGKNWLSDPHEYEERGVFLGEGDPGPERRYCGASTDDMRGPLAGRAHFISSDGQFAVVTYKGRWSLYDDEPAARWTSRMKILTVGEVVDSWSEADIERALEVLARLATK